MYSALRTSSAVLQGGLRTGKASVLPRATPSHTHPHVLQSPDVHAHTYVCVHTDIKGAHLLRIPVMMASEVFSSL